MLPQPAKIIHPRQRPTPKAPPRRFRGGAFTLPEGSFCIRVRHVLGARHGGGRLESSHPVSLGSRSRIPLVQRKFNGQKRGRHERLGWKAGHGAGCDTGWNHRLRFGDGSGRSVRRRGSHTIADRLAMHPDSMRKNSPPSHESLTFVKHNDFSPEDRDGETLQESKGRP